MIRLVKIGIFIILVLLLCATCVPSLLLRPYKLLFSFIAHHDLRISILHLLDEHLIEYLLSLLNLLLLFLQLLLLLIYKPSFVFNYIPLIPQVVLF